MHLTGSTSWRMVRDFPLVYLLGLLPCMINTEIHSKSQFKKKEKENDKLTKSGLKEKRRDNVRNFTFYWMIDSSTECFSKMTGMNVYVNYAYPQPRGTTTLKILLKNCPTAETLLFKAMGFVRPPKTWHLSTRRFSHFPTMSIHLRYGQQ